LLGKIDNILRNRKEPIRNQIHIGFFGQQEYSTGEQHLFILSSLFFVVGFISLCFSSSLYMTADLGVSTYDAIAIVMAEKWKMGKFKYIRIATDVVCVVLGITLFLLGGGKPSEITASVGIGTILTAFFMGPLIDFFNKTVAIPMLNKKK
jgi:uncharacterized membrane protein YczE